MPDDDVACRMTAPAKLQVEMPPVAAKVDAEMVLERLCRPGKAWNFLRLLEQARHAAEFAVPVLLAALLDQFAGSFARDDMLGREGACAQNAHRMIMSEDQIFDRFIGVLAQFIQPVASRRGGCSRLDADEEILALYSADIRVP